MKTTCALILLAICLLPGCERARLNRQLEASFREQEARNEAAKPLLEATVVRKVKIGDSIERVTEILTAAGLEGHLETFHPEFRSSYRTGKGCGLGITFSLDAEKRVSKIEVRPFMTGP